MDENEEKVRTNLLTGRVGPNEIMQSMKDAALSGKGPVLKGFHDTGDVHYDDYYGKTRGENRNVIRLRRVEREYYDGEVDEAAKAASFAPAPNDVSEYTRRRRELSKTTGVHGVSMDKDKNTLDAAAGFFSYLHLAPKAPASQGQVHSIGNAPYFGVDVLGVLARFYRELKFEPRVDDVHFDFAAIPDAPRDFELAYFVPGVRTKNIRGKKMKQKYIDLDKKKRDAKNSAKNGGANGGDSDDSDDSEHDTGRDRGE